MTKLTQWHKIAITQSTKNEEYPLNQIICSKQTIYQELQIKQCCTAITTEEEII